MLTSDTNKNYLKLALYGLVMLVVLLPFNQAGNAAPETKLTQAIPTLKDIKAIPKTNLSPAATTAVETNDTIASGVEIIVEDKPLAIPRDFMRTLNKLGITGITLGDKQGRIRLLRADGTYVNPCATTDKVLDSKTAGRDIDQPCRFAAELGETHMLIANNPLALTGCGTCQAGGTSRVCNKTSKKYTCSTQANLCQTNCI